MKRRQGFVSNSSSSSFIIKKRYLNEEQIEKIKNHSTSGLDCAESDPWSIEEDEYYLKGWVFMDNFDMREFFDLIGVELQLVEWGD